MFEFIAVNLLFPLATSVVGHLIGGLLHVG